MSDEQQAPPMATPRVAAGALFFDEKGRVLLVKPTYKDGWDIPGGYVEPGESPLDACRREVQEELDFDLGDVRLLAVDWAPNPAEGDKLLFVFDGGTRIAESRTGIRLDGSELSQFQFVAVDSLDQFLSSRLQRRVDLAAKTRHLGLGATYAENGECRP